VGDVEVPPLLGRPLRRGELIAADGMAATGYALIVFTMAVFVASPVPLWARALIVAGISVPAACRRLWPLPIVAVLLVASVVGIALGVVREPFVAGAFALYPVAVASPRRRREPTLAIGAVSVIGLLGFTVMGSSTVLSGRAGLVGLGCGIMGGTWTVGRAVRERRAYAARSAEQVARHAADEERLRIARELHDVMSHTLSLIGVKAAVADHVAETRPDEVRDALRVIADTSRTALAEMRHMLAALRSGDADAGLEPLPRYAGLSEIADRAALAGVRVVVDRRVEDLPHALELAVHRIVQEAVTNVIKHAAPTHCRVTVAGDQDEVRIEVTDDGPGHRTLPRPPGHGLIGIRERVNLHGGTFAAGPRPQGGFAVCVRLPYRPEGAIR
jgi:signal transduction histidine kinase